MTHHQSARFGYLDGLRGLAALNVAVHHTIIAFDFAPYSGLISDAHGTWELPLSKMPFLIVFSGANVSVSIFFVLSGFVLTHSFLHSRLSLPALIVKRYIRLGMPILAVCIISWFVLLSGAYYNRVAFPITHSSWANWMLKSPPDFVQALREGAYADLLGPWAGADAYDPALWTMSVEFLGSVMLIVLVSVGRRWIFEHRYLAGFLFFLAAVLINQLYLALFACGVAIYLFDISRFAATSQTGRCFAWLTLGIGLLLGTIPFSAVRDRLWDILATISPSPLMTPTLDQIPGLIRFHDGSYFWHGIGAILVVISIEISPVARKLLAQPFTIYLGRISYPLYLVHIPVVLSFGSALLVGLNAAGMPYIITAPIAASLSVGLSISIANIGVRYIEKPTISLAEWVAQVLQGSMSRTRRGGFLNL